MNKDNLNKIKDIISTEELAFVIGNGINLRFFSNVKSWNKLLESLWDKYCKHNSCGTVWNDFIDSGTGEFRGLTTTELFDLIEMNYYGHITSISFSDMSKYGKSISEYIKNLKEKVQKREAVSSIVPKTQDELLKEFKKTNDEFKQNCRNWCKENITNADELTDGDCALKMMEVISSNQKLQQNRNQLKKEIAKEYDNYPKSSGLNDFMLWIKDKNAPVLTTNFDRYMSMTLELEQYKMGEGFTDFYPWNLYYSYQQLKSPVSGFGIWHINGLDKYHRSIRLGLSDYMGCVERARNMIHFKNMNDFFDGKNQDNWIGQNTWLHIIFNKNLFVFGLKLDDNEVFLRWLLIQRAKYSKMYNKHLKGWYVNQGISDGKRAFLETLGFTVINISDHNELYNAFC